MAASRWLLVGVVLLAGALAFGDEKAPPSEKEIKSLIDQLVSPNPKPITGDEDERVAPEYRLPEGFDQRKQRAVHDARSRLKEIGPPAFPYLVECWSDKRYCLTTSHGLYGYCQNESVGEICEAIILDQLQPYSYWPAGYDDPRGHPHRPSYPSTFLASAETAKKWCDWNKHQSLYVLQLGILDWVIAAESERPGDFTDEERAELQKIRRELTASGKPLLRGNYNLTDIEQ